MSRPGIYRTYSSLEQGFYSELGENGPRVIHRCGILFSFKLGTARPLGWWLRERRAYPRVGCTICTLVGV